MTPDFETRLKKAIDGGILPGIVLLARDKSGWDLLPLSSHPPISLP
jgi:hypothetical protein